MPTYTLTCGPIETPITITTEATYSVQAGEELSIPLTATGGQGPLTYNISASDNTIYQIDESNVLRWANNAAQSAGDYTVTLLVSDGFDNSDSLTITITVTAPALVYPGAVTDLTAAPINETTVVLAFTPASNATSYYYSANGSPEKPMPFDNRIRLLSPSTAYTVRVWGRNENGDGTADTADCTTLAPSQTVNDVWRGMLFDEVNRSEYSFTFTVNAGAANNFLLIGAVAHTGSANPNVINSVLVNDAPCDPVVVSSAAGAVFTGFYKYSWGVGALAGTVTVKVRVYNAANTAALTAQRCGCSLKEIVNRSATPVATYVDSTAPLSQSVTLTSNQVVMALTAATAVSSAIDLTADINRLTIEDSSENYQQSLNFIQGFHSSPDGETRTIGADWADIEGGTTAGNQRMVAVIYDAPLSSIPAVTPRAADSLVDMMAFDTHMDWSRGTGSTAVWHWEPGEATPNLSNLITAMGNLGVRYARASPYKTLSKTATNTNNQLYRYMLALYDTYGIQGFGPPGTLEDTTADIQEAIRRTELYINEGGKRRWKAYEGANESNSGRPAGWNTDLVTFMQTLRNYINANYPAAEIIGPSIWGRNQADIDTLAATPGWSESLQDYACFHTYNGGRKPTTSGDPLLQQGDETGGPTTIPYRNTFLDHTALFGDLPLWITEIGYKLANPQGIKGWTMPAAWVRNYGNNAISNKAFMKYLLRYFMSSVEICEEFSSFARFSHYVFQDDVETQPNNCFGFTYANQAKTALLFRPVYYSWQRFINLFKDKTWNAGADAWQYSGAGPTLTGLSFDITGGNGLTRPIVYGQKQKGMLFRKQDGKYLIPLYQDETSWDQSAGADYSTPVDPTQYWCNADIDPTRRTVTFDAGSTVTSIKWYEPTFDNTGTYPANGGYGTASTATARKTANNTRTMTIDVPDHVGVIEVTP
jgi:hypothetical protein